MSTPCLPEAFVGEANGLGFALVEGERPYTFIRRAIWGELRLFIQATGSETWRVGLAFRVADEPDRLPNPILSLPLEKYGPSSDGTTIDVSSDALSTDVPRLLQECILPIWDLAPS